jgi:hypothetical protein
LPPITYKLNNQITSQPLTNLNPIKELDTKFSTKLNLNEVVVTEEDVEPNENDENSILIAIRLPSGETIKRYFLKTDLVLNIIKFASKKSGIDFNEKSVKLLEMPKNIIENFNMTIDHYGLKNRTMLHIIFN